MAIWQKYSDLESLLVEMMIGACYENKQDIDVIKEYVSKYQNLNAEIRQCKELLSLPEEEFPSDWVGETMNTDFPDGCDSARDVIQWIVEELEKEAKKQGKL